jgi:hypothetical protein
MDTNEPLIDLASRQINKMSRRGILFTGAAMGILFVTQNFGEMGAVTAFSGLIIQSRIGK